MQQLLMVLLMPLFALSITTYAEKYTEGKQYTKVNEPNTANRNKIDD